MDEVIGYSDIYHGKSSVGCFYTNALRSEMNVYLTFQNSGGVRNSLDERDILVREIYSIDPFNNGSVIYTMTVAEVKTFMENVGGLYYSGFEIEQIDQDIVIKNGNGEVLTDNVSLTIGVNDYIPAVYDRYFPQERNILPKTTAETLINYLNNTNESVNYPQCDRFFRYQ